MTTTDGRPATVAATAVPAEKAKKRSGGGYRIGYGHWWWAVPAVALMLALIYATTASGAFYAFTNWTGIGDFDLVGFKNFTDIFQTPELTGALVNTLVLAFG